MSLAAILFIKNENKFIYGPNDPKPSVTMLEQQLMFLESFVDAVYILDGDSTDGSIELYKKYYQKGLVKYWETPKYFDEKEYCSRLLEFVKFNNHTWMLYLDGDEILEDAARFWINDFMIGQKYPNIRKNINVTVRFNYINLWRSRFKYRKDKWYNTDSGKLFSVTKELTSYGTFFNNHYYAYSSPDDFGDIFNPGLKLLHYAWVDWDHQVKKAERNAWIESSTGKISYEEAKKIHDIILDEQGIVLENVSPVWQEEFRTGKILYNKTEENIPSSSIGKIVI